MKAPRPRKNVVRRYTALTRAIVNRVSELVERDKTKKLSEDARAELWWLKNVLIKVVDKMADDLMALP